MRKKVVKEGRRGTPTKPQVGEMLDSFSEDVNILLEKFQSFKFAKYEALQCFFYFATNIPLYLLHQVVTPN
jgi:hypothetical protein